MKKILLGGIPLGCNNIGDEAIIDCVCEIFYRNFSDIELTVMTADKINSPWRPERKLAPLYGFDENYSYLSFREFVKDFDYYIWAGATGLSDYPQTAIRLLKEAQKANVPTVVWNVGMNEKLNPYFFEASGKRYKLMFIAGKMIGKSNYFIDIYNNYLSCYMYKQIVNTLQNCELVVVRNKATANRLKSLGLESCIVGADSAILNCCREQKEIRRKQNLRTIGLCISEQSMIKERDELIKMLNSLLELDDIRLIFIPMNLKSDALVLRDIANDCINNSKIIVADKSDDPGIIQHIASKCDVVISSRLHLLIFSSNVFIPIVGINRGSKIGDFLANFKLKPQGNVENCDYNLLKKEALRLIKNKDKFQPLSQAVHKRLKKRLKTAETHLKKIIKP